MKCQKVNLKKVNLSKTFTWNMWNQFNIDLDNYNGPNINVSDHFMPENELTRLKEYMLTNWRRLKSYKPPNKLTIERHWCLEYLDYSPSSIEKGVD